MIKKIFAAITAIALISPTAFAQKDMFLPEAKNDSAVIVLDEKKTVEPINLDEVAPPEQTASPSPSPTAAEPSPEPTAAPEITSSPMPEPTSSPAPSGTFSETFTANFTVEGKEGELNAPKTAKFALYDGDVKLGEKEYTLTADTKEFSVVFDVPRYTIGKQFSLVCTEGAWGIRYYDDFYETNKPVPAPTYEYTDEEGNYVKADYTAVSLLTIKDRQINIYVDGQLLELKSQPRYINGVIMVPVRETAEALGVFDVTYNGEYNSVRVAVKDKETLFNIDYPWTTVNGENRVDGAPTQYVGSNVYVPVKTLADGVASKYEEWEHPAYADILLSRSNYVRNYIEKVNYVNEKKLTSQTEYLIWISKANYEVNVFKNSGGVWNFVNAYRCAIGAPGSPTCVGTYRYYEKIAQWKYPDFYVGPVMRFNGGYAIHSTLLKYDGTDYNRTVGKKLSHGCVRVQPPDMEWLITNIPMYTTIHVTDE